MATERERERQLLEFDDPYSYVPAERAAASALRASRQRKVTILYRIGLGLATAATLLTLFVLRAVPSSQQAQLKETFRLQCLSPDQAAELLRPVLGKEGRITMRPDGLGLITVQAPREAMQRAWSVIDQYDSPALSQCAVQVRVPK